MQYQDLTVVNLDLVKLTSMTRAAICERRENLDGGGVMWAVRFTHPTSQVNHRQTLWLDGKTPTTKDGLDFFKNGKECQLFAIGFENDRDVAVKFSDYAAAVKFLAFAKGLCVEA